MTSIKSDIDFNAILKNFVVSQAMLDQSIAYAEKLGVAKKPADIVISSKVIKNRMKAELARHIWEDNGYYSVYLEDDLDVQSALKHFK